MEHGSLQDSTAPTKQPTSLAKPIDTMLATSDSLKVSAEAAWGGAAEAVEALELPGFDSLVSMLWSEADLGSILTRVQLISRSK